MVNGYLFLTHRFVYTPERKSRMGPDASEPISNLAWCFGGTFNA